MEASYYFYLLNKKRGKNFLILPAFYTVTQYFPSDKPYTGLYWSILDSFYLPSIRFVTREVLGIGFVTRECFDRVVTLPQLQNLGPKYVF